MYDYKFDDLSVIAYNELLKNIDKYRVRPEFYVINFDDPRRSHRCNPISPKFMADISDAYESAYTILLNLNKTWIQKQGDFFVESPIILLAAIIWYLRIYKDGKYCTFPHAIEFLNKPYADIFTILTSYPSLENYPLSLYGCLARRRTGPVTGPDSERKNPAFKDDFTAAILGNDRR